MSYALLVIEPPGQRRTRSDAEGREVYGRMLRFGEDLKRRGLLTVSQSLKIGSADARVTMRESAVVITDGPFAEVKEVIGGFFLLTCDTREQAIGIARECPAAEWATIEVRELGPCFA
ncbi:MAG TPA: YciI family protein [Steroidobacteraceae bacterium]|nr:YciI family protein [Steroidobacteraceae bacterium]